VITNSPWPARDEELRAHWATGLSARLIGEAMSISKNAVVGRAHRIGLVSRPSPIIVDGKPRVRIARVRGPTLPDLSVARPKMSEDERRQRKNAAQRAARRLANGDKNNLGRSFPMFSELVRKKAAAVELGGKITSNFNPGGSLWNKTGAMIGQETSAKLRDLAAIGWDRFSDDASPAPARHYADRSIRSTRVRECLHMAGDAKPYVACANMSEPGSRWCADHAHCGAAPQAPQRPREMDHPRTGRGA